MPQHDPIRRGTASALALASLILPANALADGSSARAVSATKSFANQTLRLDSHRASDADSAIVSTSQRLRRGDRYTLTVEGTASYYSPASYSALQRPLVLCGTPERAAMFRSPGTENGPVGVDPEFVFARPWTRSQCGRVPGHWSNFQIRTSRFFFHPAPRGRTSGAARSDHTYTYTIIGRGRAATFRLVDGAGARDNYGVFRIGIRDVAA
ncbi:MAG: hypothetical protein QOK14_578 [Frankiaceae bacterium]|nr:hypothetical protein [Frankiaceae bacterium]